MGRTTSITAKSAIQEQVDSKELSEIAESMTMIVAVAVVIVLSHGTSGIP